MKTGIFTHKKCIFGKVAGLLTLLLLVQNTLAVLFTVPAYGAAPSSGGPDPNFHIYLAFGQSNMTGVAQIAQEDLEGDDGYLMMCTCNHVESDYYPENRTLGNWYKATPPLSGYSGAGLSLADYFGRRMLELKRADNPDIRVGIVMVDVPGVHIQLFDKEGYQSYLQVIPVDVDRFGGNPYQRLVGCARLAQGSGVIKGIILHQGENDLNVPGWSDRVDKIYHDLVRDAGLSEGIPFLAGEVRQGTAWSDMNRSIDELVLKGEQYHVVSSNNLTETDETPGDIHFNASECRAFGRRYAEVMYEVEKSRQDPGGEVIAEQPGSGGQSVADILQQEAQTAEPFVPAVDKVTSDDSGQAYYRITALGKSPTVTYQSLSAGGSVKVNIPDKVSIAGKEYKVTAIAQNGFKNNRGLSEVTIGKNVKSIGKNAFSGCKKLKKIRIKTTKLTKKSVGKNAFKGIHKKAKVKVQGKKLGLYKTILRSKGLKGKKQKIKR